MSAYENLQKLEELPYFNLLLTNGIIPMTWIDYKVIYEFYLDQLKDLERQGFASSKAKGTANTITADEYSISERTVYVIIQKMK